MPAPTSTMMFFFSRRRLAIEANFSSNELPLSFAVERDDNDEAEIINDMRVLGKKTVRSYSNGGCGLGGSVLLDFESTVKEQKIVVIGNVRN